MEVQKIKLTVAYDGTDFHGFQRQPGLRTVQGVLEEWLETASGRTLEVIGASRTDAGVHAKQQVVHFLADQLPIPAENLTLYARGTLPSDIVIVHSESAHKSFNSRMDARWKTYRYVIQTGRNLDVFKRRYAMHVPVRLDLDAMRQAAAKLVGTHDFTSFCSTKAIQENKVRTLHQVSCIATDQDQILIEVTGSGFLHNMVRIIVGTLLAVGRGKIKADAVTDIITAKDRRKAGPTALARGLTLWHIEYDMDWS